MDLLLRSESPISILGSLGGDNCIHSVDLCYLLCLLAISSSHTISTSGSPHAIAEMYYYCYTYLVIANPNSIDAHARVWGSGEGRKGVSCQARAGLNCISG